MPQPNDPPDPGITSTVFNALQAMSYDASLQAFKDTAGDRYFLFVQRKSNTVDVAEWVHATDTEGGDNPRGLVPQLTFDVIKSGTLNTQTQKIAYAGKNYRIRLQRD